MINSYSNIDDYINSFAEPIRLRLQELRKIIKDIAPNDSKETINYAMPTFRWNGNLIHFAQTKNHIGLYPGTAAIAYFKEDLKCYKTSKGAIQLPMDEPLPKKIIEDLVLFNIKAFHNKSAPKWDTYRSAWLECDEFMQQLIADLALKKEFKWGNTIYTYKGKKLIAWAGFKNFFSLWFYNGVFLEDKYKVLVSGTEGKTKALRQWRFTNLQEMDSTRILAYIHESIQTIDAGKEIKIEKITAPIEINTILKEALSNNKSLDASFKSLTASKQREYNMYIAEAKQDKTKSSRIEKIIPLILGGKGLNDKYKNNK